MRETKSLNFVNEFGFFCVYGVPSLNITSPATSGRVDGNGVWPTRARARGCDVASATTTRLFLKMGMAISKWLGDEGGRG